MLKSRNLPFGNVFIDFENKIIQHNYFMTGAFFIYLEPLIYLLLFYAYQCAITRVCIRR